MTALIPARTIRKGAFCLIMALLALSGCRTQEFVPDAKFVDLYVELKMATVAVGDDLEKINEVRRAILARHQTNPDEFHKQYVGLMEHPEAWRRFQELVIEKADGFYASHKSE